MNGEGFLDTTQQQGNEMRSSKRRRGGGLMEEECTQCIGRRRARKLASSSGLSIISQT